MNGAVAVVTGASSGIGRAVAECFHARGATVCLLARSVDVLEQMRRCGGSGRFVPYPADLTVDDDIRSVATDIGERFGRVDVLVHCAAIISTGPVSEASVAALDAQYRTNLRAPYVLTQALLSLLCDSRGQVVFINSTAGLTAPANAAQYAATKHALKALADCLREEVNPHGVRVLSLFPGRTATRMQQQLMAAEGKPWRPEVLIDPGDIADLLVHVLAAPRTAEITNIVMRPMTNTTV